MSESPEPKKMRLSEDQKGSIQIILPDSLLLEMKFVKSVIGIVTDKKSLSQFIKEINRTFPLPIFQHLKRVKGNEIFLFPWTQFSGSEDHHEQLTEPIKSELKSFMKENKFPDQLLKECDFRLADIPETSPQNRKQYESAIASWPCKFHEDKMVEKMMRNEMFSDNETQFHLTMMELCLGFCAEFNRKHLSLAFDPSTNRIVACGWTTHDNSLLINGPKNHSPMMAIDNVAKSQGGGAWNDTAAEQSYIDGRKHLEEQFERLGLKNERQTAALKYGPYLCTGLDLYLTDEPCLMCAMALVHSRAKRIFFCRPNERNGALGGDPKNPLKLHGIRELNHHYDVFRIHTIKS